GGVRGGGRRVRQAGGGADRQRDAVRDRAGQGRLHARVREAGGQADRRLAAPAADAGEGGAVLGDLVAGVRGGGGVPGPRGRPAAHRAVHRPLQLPAAAPGDRRADAGRPVLRGGRGGAADAGSAGAGERV